MSKLPTSPGYYWAKWKQASDGTHEGEELTPSNIWEIVQVNENCNDPENPEYLSVAVAGVRETQWPQDFFWGAKVSDLGQQEVRPDTLNSKKDFIKEFEELKQTLRRGLKEIEDKYRKLPVNLNDRTSIIPSMIADAYKLFGKHETIVKKVHVSVTGYVEVEAEPPEAIKKLVGPFYVTSMVLEK
jgi:hypothetical protein